MIKQKKRTHTTGNKRNKTVLVSGEWYREVYHQVLAKLLREQRDETIKRKPWPGDLKRGAA